MGASCCGNESVKLLYTCSGAADVGELADRTVRKLWKEGFATKTCLAGVGADLSGFVESAKGADVNITIDGCATACAKKSLERIGVKPIAIVLSDLGFKKGESPVTDEDIEKICNSIKNITKSETQASSSSSNGCGCGS